MPSIRRVYDYVSGTCDETRTADDGEQTEETRTIDDGEQGVEERHLDFSAEVKPLTKDERRWQVNNFEAQVRNEREEAFRDYLRHGKDGLIDTRAQAESTDASGGFLVPEGFSRQFLVSLKAYDGIFDAATVVPTDTGAEFPMSVDDDTANNAAIVSESGTSSARDVAFDYVNFGKCPTWRSGVVRAPIELVGDAGFNFQSLLATLFAKRFARGIGAAHITTLLNAATSGKTASSGTAVTPDEILDLMQSVDSAFYAQGSFLMNSTSLLNIQKIKASTGGSYLAPVGTDAAGRPTLFGKTVYLSPSMPAMTTGLKAIMFGDLSKWLRREVRGSLTTKVYIERYIEYGQYGYEGFWRVDGALAKAANAPVPVRYLTMG